MIEKIYCNENKFSVVKIFYGGRRKQGVFNECTGKTRPGNSKENYFHHVVRCKLKGICKET